MTKPPYQIDSSLRKNYPAHHPQESSGMVEDVVPISLGGTGATTAQGARNNLGTNDASNLTTGTLPNARVSNSLTPDKAFRRGNILGNVSQSGGVPTGAIIERGSNANGEYVRFADGTQICWRNSLPASSPPNVAAGSIFRNNGDTWVYPVSFVGPVSAGLTGAGSNSRWATHNSSGTMPSQINVWMYSTGSSGIIGSYFGLYAFGRWF